MPSDPAPRPGLYESTEPCLLVTSLKNGDLRFYAAEVSSQSTERAARLLRLLAWFPLPATSAKQLSRLARHERFTMEDLALHVWSLALDEGFRSMDELQGWRLRKLLRGFGMLPRWWRRPAFFDKQAVLRLARVQAKLMRHSELPGFEADVMRGRLEACGLTREMVEREIVFEGESGPDFPVVTAAAGKSEAGDAGLRALTEALADREGAVSLADVEQVLLDCRRGDPQWLRGYSA